MFKKIGHVAVDSGQIMIIDPCYIESNWKGNDFHSNENENGEYVPTNETSYDGCCTATLSENRAGQAGLAVASSSGHGDGEYPVYAEYDENGRVIQVIIDFDDIHEGVFTEYWS